MTPNARDLAMFWRYALQSQLVQPAAVIAWADRIVASHDEPPAWAIELCMAHPDEIDRLLQRVPSEPSGRLAVHVLFALVRREWLAGRLSLRDVLGIGGEFHGDDLLPNSPRDWAVCFNADVGEAVGSTAATRGSTAWARGETRGG